MRMMGRLAALALVVLVAACDSDPLEGRACITNQDCAAGQSCVSGACIDQSGCTSDLECSAGEVCNMATGQCEQFAPLSCGSDSECPAGQRCNTLTGVCIDGNRPCQSTTDCESIGQVCDPARGECVECLGTNDCVAPATCVDGACLDGVTPVCVADAECMPPDTVCQDGQCRPGCGRPGSPVQCVSGEVCDAATGRCTPAGQSCGSDADCGAPVQICEMSQCVPGCANGGSCAADEVCNTGTGRCERVVGPCMTDAECGPPTMVCESGQCVGGCGEPVGIQCAGDQTCNRMTGRCEGGTTPTMCMTDSDCNPPTTICDAATMTCAAGCGTTGCPSGQMCNSTSGRCENSQTGGGGSMGINTTCTLNSDCQTGVCFDFGGSLGQMCAKACACSNDCPNGFTIGGDYLGAKTCIAASFFTGATFTTPIGGSCTSGNECRSGYCPTSRNQCVDTCAEDGDCAAGETCRWDEVVSDFYISACGATGPGPGANGSTCASDADCLGGVCYGSGICGSLCGSTADCPTGNACLPVNYSVCQFAIIDCLQWQVNLVKACVQVDPSELGTGAIGSPCTAGNNCRDGFCNTASGVCTGACSRDADCPSNMRCGIEQYGSLGNDPVYFNACIVP